MTRTRPLGWHCMLTACDWCDSGRWLSCPRRIACGAVNGASEPCGRSAHIGSGDTEHRFLYYHTEDVSIAPVLVSWRSADGHTAEPEEEPVSWTSKKPAPFDENGQPTDSDPINHPSHYTSHPSGVECIAIVRHMSFNLGAATKYIWRNGLKPGNAAVQDLEKAIWHIRDEIKRLQKQAADGEDDLPW